MGAVVGAVVDYVGQEVAEDVGVGGAGLVLVGDGAGEVGFRVDEGLPALGVGLEEGFHGTPLGFGPEVVLGGGLAFDAEEPVVGGLEEVHHQGEFAVGLVGGGLVAEGGEDEAAGELVVVEEAEEVFFHI